MFDLFTDNPVLILIIIFVIVRLLRGNKGKKPGAPEHVRGGNPRMANLEELKNTVERERSSSRGGSARASRLGDLKAALDDAMREADRQFSPGGPRADASPGDAPASPLPALPTASPADPYAFHSLMNREGERVADSSRTDYDTTGIDYDTRSDAFAFRSSSNEPAEQEYHLTGFRGFKPVGGLTTDRVRVRAVGEAAGVEEERNPLQAMLADPDQLRRAVILHEILERPVSLRRR